MDAIYDFTYKIPELHHRKTINPKYGVFYCRYKVNNKTIWFVTFDMEDDIFVVQYITNNHSKDYPSFIKGIIVK